MTLSPNTRARAALAVALPGLALAMPAAASADPPPSVLQYVEVVPSGSGSAPVDLGESARVDLPTAAAAALRRDGGADGEALDELATSPGLGAPQGSLGRSDPAGATAAGAGSLLSADALGAAAGGGGALPVVLVLLAVVTLAAAGARVVGGRRR